MEEKKIKLYNYELHMKIIIIFIHIYIFKVYLVEEICQINLFTAAASLVPTPPTTNV